jgi:hypothetical protein
MSEIEQRYVIKFFDVKRFALDRIVAEFASVSGEQASAKKAVEYWIQQVKFGRLDMKEEGKHGHPPLDDVDARILACLSHELFSSIRSIG